VSTAAGGGAIDAAALSVSSTGSGSGISLSDAGNAVGSVTLGATGNIVFTDSPGFTETGINATGSASLTAIGGGINGSGGAITVSDLRVTAAGPIGLTAASNNVSGTVGLTTTAGDIQFSDAAAFTVVGVSGPLDVTLQASGLTLAGGITAGQNASLASGGALAIAGNGGAITAGGNVLVTASNGPLALTGNIPITAASGTGDVILESAGGGISQAGVLDPHAGIVAVDTTGLGAATIAAQLAGRTPSASLIDLFPPSGAQTAAMSFGDLEAPGSVLLLIADRGTIGGSVNVAALGISGTLGSAALSGAIGGNDRAQAALLGVIVPGSSADYLFNGCIIGATACTGTPPPPQPPAPTEVASETPPVIVSPPSVVETTATAPPTVDNAQSLVSVQLAPVSEIDALTGQPVDPDAPVIDIFDEERLCHREVRPKELPPEACQ
jgi:hypothetical protein